MTQTYITGTTTPGSALTQFLPDYLNTLHHRGEQLVTTSKTGVDEQIIAHCEQHQLPLTVYAFRNRGNYRKIENDAPHIDVRTIETPTWLRFRHISEKTQRLIFLHSTKSSGKRNDLSTIERLDIACRKRGLDAEQHIIQKQYDFFVNCTDLRAAPCLGAAHIYLYTRNIHSTDDNRYFIGHYCVETWRQIGGVVQPGNGRRELVIAATSIQHALLQLLQHALAVLKDTPPYSLVIHADRDLQKTVNSRHRCAYSDLKADLRQTLAAYPLVTWHTETRAALRKAIGSHIQQQNELWDHKRSNTNTKGLYT
jgi:hypothetical protein